MICTDRRSFLIGAGQTLIYRTTFNHSPERISVETFGARAGSKDCGPGVRAAIAALEGKTGATLFFPPGSYYFKDTGDRAMVIKGMHNLTIEGDRALLLLEGKMGAIRMLECAAPAIKGLTFDWVRPPFSQGEVIAAGSAGRSATVKIDQDFPVDGSERVLEIGTYDRNTRAMAWHGIDEGGSTIGVSLVGPQTLDLKFTRPVPLKPGDVIVCRHLTGPAVVELLKCSDFYLGDLNIYAGAGMGVAIGGCDRGSVSRLQVRQTPGSRRLMSTNADALHCASCSGELDIDDCVFSGMGDDGINVTGLYQGVRFGGNPRSLELTGGRYAPTPLWAAPNAGDRLLLVSGATLRPLAEVELATIHAKEGSAWDAELIADAPTQAGDGPVFAIDLQRRAKLRVSGCNFLGNRARGVLAHGDATIEKCSFQRQSESAVLLAPDMYWQEGPSVERTIVRDNQFSDVNLLGGAAGAIWISAFVTVGGRQGIPTPEIVNDSVAVVNNSFVRPNTAALAAAATRNLRIENNRIDKSGPVAFLLSNVQDVTLRGNRCRPEATIAIDQSSRETVKLNDNVGLRYL